MSRAVCYSFGFDGLGGGYASGRLFVFLCYQLVGMCFEFRRTVSLFIVQTFRFYIHILGRLFALSFLFFMTLSTSFL